MARIKYSGLIDEIKGSIGGTCFQSNKYGFTVKRKPSMVKPNRPAQNNMKRLMSLCTRQWRELTQVQRDAYSTFASTFPQYAKNNPSAQLSGYAIFVKWNVLNLLSSRSFFGNITQAVPDTDTVTITITNDSGVLKINMTSVNDDEEWAILMFMSRPFPPSKNFIGSAPRYIDLQYNIDASNTITTEYQTVYGIIPSVGDYVAVDMLFISDYSPYVLGRDSQIYEVGETP